MFASILPLKVEGQSQICQIFAKYVEYNMFIWLIEPNNLTKINSVDHNKL